MGRRTVKPTRDGFLLVAGLASVVLGVWLLLTPEPVAAPGPLGALSDTDTAAQVGLLVGLVVAVLAAFQMRKTARETLDRSDLLPAPPEQARDARVPRPSAPFARRYRRLGATVERFGPAGWQVIAYGRRAGETIGRSPGIGRPDPARQRVPRGSSAESGQRDPSDGGDRPEPSPECDRRGRPPAGRQHEHSPESNRHSPRAGAGDSEPSPSQRDPPPGGRERDLRGPPPGADRGWRSPGAVGQPSGHRGPSRLLALLDEVAVTARDSYAAATGCDEETAERAVETGAWTDDRVAAAFLATAHEAPSFTVTERALAWLAPQRTLDRRLDRTLNAIEEHTETFLTYRASSTDRIAEGER